MLARSALGGALSLALAACDSGSTLLAPPGEPRETQATPPSRDDGVPAGGEQPVVPDGPATVPPTSGSDPVAMLPPEEAPNDGVPGSDPGASGVDPTPPSDVSPVAPGGPAEDPGDPSAEPSEDDPDDPPPPDDPSPGDPGDPDDPEDPEPLPPDPSEPEPVDHSPAPGDVPSIPADPPPGGASEEDDDDPPPVIDPPSTDPPNDNPPNDNPPNSNPPSSGGGDVVGPQSPEIPGGLASFHIAVIGSSTAGGVGASSGDSAWVNLLETSLSRRAMTPVTTTNLAVGGYTAYDLAPGSGMPGSIDDAIRDKPDLILIALAGSNDLDGTITTEFFVSQLVSLRETAKAAGIPTFFMGTLPKNFTDLNRQLLIDFDRAMASEFSACWIPGATKPYAPCYIDVFESLADTSHGLAPQYDSGDGQHPNDAGHAVLFQAVDAIVEPYVCTKTSCK